ncbi:MAG TPA: hypothetical protein VJ997_03865 [Longimicrobiales bacterium]|nr:hypothetical protein [Longimicrobiales bacterium]
MKKALTALLVLALLSGAYLTVAHLSGGALSTLGLALGGDRGELRRIALSFLEDLQFKDFDKAASYHAPDLLETVDIPFLLQRMFAVKPEALDIMDYEVVFADLDSSKLRARVKVRVKAKLLLDGRVDERELVLFFHRDSVHDPWYMKLEDSLRELSPDSTRQH